MEHPHGPTLVTERLILRPPRPEDFDGWMELMGDPVAARFIGGAQPPAAAWRGFTCMAGAWALYGFGMFSVLERATGRCIGRLGPWRPHGWPGDEIGYGLVRGAWGKGYATEGCTAAIDWALEQLGWTGFIHCIAPDNTASQAVATRLGSRRVGPTRLPPPFEDAAVELWAQSADDWRARRC